MASIVQVGFSTNMSDFPTNQDLASQNVPTGLLTRNNFGLARQPLSKGKGESSIPMVSRFQSLQLRILRFGLFEDGDVRVGVFPQREKIAVLFATLVGITHHYLGTCELQSR